MIRLAAILALAAAPAMAHEAPEGWVYDAICCNGTAHAGDCAPIPDSAVTVAPDGVHVTLNPGDHRRVRWTQSYAPVPYDKLRQSPDEHYHACLYPSQETLRCLYQPRMGS